jgi:hypothetical protein
MLDAIGSFASGRPDGPLLARAVDAVLATRPPWGAFTGVPWAYFGTTAELHTRATS